MYYFHFPPFKKQYLFPSQILKYETLKSMYTPYSLLSKLLWILCCYTQFKFLFKANKSKVQFIYHNLNLSAIGNPIFAVNFGTKGPEQKVTVLAFSPELKKYFFFKAGSTELSKKLIQNEAHVLQQLKGNSFCADFISLDNQEGLLVLKTDTFQGRKIDSIKLNQVLIDFLIQKEQLKPKCDIKSTTQLRMAFGHGDFCPWNILTIQNDLKIIDWEMAGYYPLGFDLFTYIFQTSFLLTPKMSMVELLNENSEFISRYFNYYEIKNYNAYLKSFFLIRKEYEDLKPNSTLGEQYSKVLKELIL